jgi:hypothetical protein
MAGCLVGRPQGFHISMYVSENGESHCVILPSVTPRSRYGNSVVRMLQ